MMQKKSVSGLLAMLWLLSIMASFFIGLKQNPARESSTNPKTTTLPLLETNQSDEIFISSEVIDTYAKTLEIKSVMSPQSFSFKFSEVPDGYLNNGKFQEAPKSEIYLQTPKGAIFVAKMSAGCSPSKGGIDPNLLQYRENLQPYIQDVSQIKADTNCWWAGGGAEFYLYETTDTLELIGFKSDECARVKGCYPFGDIINFLSLDKKTYEILTNKTRDYTDRVFN